MDLQRLFDNYFDDKNIINRRLVDFAEDCLGRFKAANAAHQFDGIIEMLQNAIGNIRSEMADVNVGLTHQIGFTLSLDQVNAGFKKTMSDLEGVIAHAFGGAHTAAYLEFYPQGITEYNRAGKTKLPELLNRVKAAATKYELQLGAAVATQLMGFEAAWEAARNAQLLQKGKVDDSRNDRNDYREALEDALIYAIHFVGMKFKRDSARCKQFFDFSLLYKTHHHQDKIDEHE